MNWVGWLLFAACCAACLVTGWAVRGAVYEREEDTVTGEARVGGYSGGRDAESVGPPGRVESTVASRQYATGIMPADAEWDRAREVHAGAERSLAATPAALVPQPVRDAVDTLGSLLSIWQGYGEEE